ncbi:MAG: hypothetical protein ABH848_06495 [Candidatus Omnitrophota bacterium]
MKILLFLFILLVSIPKDSFSLEIKNSNEYLIDARGDDGDIYSTYISLNKKLDKMDATVSLFLDTQWNIDITDWEKLELGIKGEKYFFNYLYLSQSIQFISGEILDHMVFDINGESIDTTTTIGLYIPLVWDLYLKVFEDYSINLEEFRDEYCESGARVIYDPEGLYSLSIGWQHTDRIHEFDTDYVTIGLDLEF